MYNKFVLFVNLAMATVTSFIDIMCPALTQDVTMYICSHIPRLAAESML